ncbi:hypothetical protein ACLOJK_029037 [Asimina triloba]
MGAGEPQVYADQSLRMSEGKMMVDGTDMDVEGGGGFEALTWPPIPASLIAFRDVFYEEGGGGFEAVIITLKNKKWITLIIKPFLASAIRLRLVLGTSNLAVSAAN